MYSVPMDLLLVQGGKCSLHSVESDQAVSELKKYHQHYDVIAV